jgi:hypothetical protein
MYAIFVSGSMEFIFASSFFSSSFFFSSDAAFDFAKNSLSRAAFPASAPGGGPDLGGPRAPGGGPGGGPPLLGRLGMPGGGPEMIVRRGGGGVGD